VLIGRHVATQPDAGQRAADTPARRRLRVGALVLGCVAVALMAIVGCTTVTEGTSTVDTAMAQAYRASVSASVSASLVTSSVRESQRQATLTKRAVTTACLSFAASAKEAVDKLNAYVDALNHGASTAATAGPAKDSLNHSADLTAGSLSDALSSELREMLTAYVDAARTVAKTISPDPAPSVLNHAIDQFNDTMTKAKRSCRAAL
jgi:flagellar hook-basal body complex protein FliE